MEISGSPSEAGFIYRFDQFELDPGRFELRRSEASVHLEPQVLAVLLLLAGNSERMVSKDELVEKVWGGRFISDAAIAARIKSARQALGDDGKEQRFIRTIHGKGFRFVAPVSFIQQGGARHVESPAQRQAEGPPSIAVLPFRFLSEPGPLSFLSDALADELITDLSRLRWLMVIARGSSFRFRGRDVDAREIGLALGVRYCLSGSVDASRGNVSIAVELVDTGDRGVVWAERYAIGADELHGVRQAIVASIAANLEVRISQHEAQVARARAPAELDCWSAYHMGIDRMFRFNRSDNRLAAEHFEQALAKDPEFGRALGGLSFTRFQDAFLQYSPTPQVPAQEARALAEDALRCDPLDPFAYLNLARSMWLTGDIPASLDLLDHSISLSPNYAQAIYAKAWADMTQVSPIASDEGAAQALRLSPLDPLRYAMLAVRSVNALFRGDYEHASEWGERAARSPGAHKHIAVIAALGTHLAGQQGKAAEWVARARERDAALNKAAFLNSFPFVPSAGREVIEATLKDLGL
ncbi:MAG: winged helix-turn-helix domain-containing protein [Porphyrobacter sp.]|nr:winged helix-turn-helix domain-containing protein [Porphyrobacter sp.]